MTYYFFSLLLKIYYYKKDSRKKESLFGRYVTLLHRRRATRALRGRMPFRVEHRLFATTRANKPFESAIKKDSHKKESLFGRYVTLLHRRRATRALRGRMPFRVEHRLFATTRANKPFESAIKKDSRKRESLFGRYVTRTRDPHNVNVMRYQLR